MTAIFVALDDRSVLGDGFVGILLAALQRLPFAASARTWERQFEGAEWGVRLKVVLVDPLLWR